MSWTTSQATPLVATLIGRSINSRGSWTTVGTTSATTATTYRRTDSNLAGGTYVYRATATNSNWRKVSADSNSRTISLRLLSIAASCA